MSKYYIDTEFDGHGGALLSIALVREDGRSIYIRTGEIARDPWVIANVAPHYANHDAENAVSKPLNSVGRTLRIFIHPDPSPVIVADSPGDIGRFCEAISTAVDGSYWGDAYDRLSFEVHNVDCYPTTLLGAVQHNAWWDAMALREILRAKTGGEG